MIVHPKAEYITSSAASKAVVNLFGLVHGKRRRFFRMKGAKANMVLPSFL
jgi:hypothetical protein